ncbi:MAG: hypothetical protein CMH83_19425 [Nocardioides sp.]|nr:hypothetical protein [Nocardioides sp.]MBS45295.1 hypothetical protein [Nocardioides sp.]
MSSTVPALDTRDHHTAITTLIDAAVAPWRCYGFGDVPGRKSLRGDALNPGTEPRQYVLLSVSRRSIPGAPRVTAVQSRSGWRADVRSVGGHRLEVQRLQFLIAQALEGAVLNIDAGESTPVAFETGEEPNADDGAVSALDSWTYTL